MGAADGFAVPRRTNSSTLGGRSTCGDRNWMPSPAASSSLRFGGKSRENRRRRIYGHYEVLTEFLAFCASDALLRGTAGRAVNDLLSNPDIRVIPQSRNSFLDGLALYNSRPDKGSRERPARMPRSCRDPGRGTPAACPR
jgi:hypothetical protein